MEAVKTQDIGVNDLPWKIEYHAERCTMCGSCVAGCSFKAIKVEVQKQSLTVSEGSQPEPKHTHVARPIIERARTTASSPPGRARRSSAVIESKTVRL